MGVGGRLSREWVYAVTAASHCGTAETNTTLESDYPPLKTRLKM